MCDVCKLVQEYDNHQRDLKFRMHQFTHCLIVGNRDEMKAAESAAVNSLHACFNTLSGSSTCVTRWERTSTLIRQVDVRL